jgi:WhiB family transcriptional regulator, redox-sensing transcriptional regulator
MTAPRPPLVSSPGAAGPLLATARDIEDIQRRITRGQQVRWIAEQYDIPLAEVRRIGIAAGRVYDQGTDRMIPAPTKPGAVPPGFDIFGLDPYDDGLPLSWRDSALCAQTDPEAFFPEKGGSTRQAKAVCRSCEVRPECLEYALEHDERFGIWGGKSERERRQLKAERAA